MRLLDWSSDSPHENLACDEAILENCENCDGDEVLRFWESPRPFIALGYTGKIAAEVNLEICRMENIPILRRCSGGGTVVQGPGCLNYALIKRIPEGAALTGISQTNCAVMQAQARALSRLWSTPGWSTPGWSTPERNAKIEIRGTSDLAIDGRKFSGNAQRRKRKYFLFHGTFLLDFDLPFIARVLRQPLIQPEYRGQRAHENFVMNLGLSARAVKEALIDEWSASGVLQTPHERIAALVKEKYARAEWNEKF